MNRKILRLAIYFFLLIIVILFGITAVKVIFFPAANEILYDAHLIYNEQFSNIIQKSKKSDKSLHLYELKIGNTGKKDQQRLKVHLPPEKSLKVSEIKVRFIVASANKVQKSKIDHQLIGDSLVYTIAPLPANRMVVMNLYSMTRRGENIFKGPAFKVEGEGRIEAADPEMTMLGRFLRTFLAFF